MYKHVFVVSHSSRNNSCWIEWMYVFCTENPEVLHCVNTKNNNICTLYYQIWHRHLHKYIYYDMTKHYLFINVLIRNIYFQVFDVNLISEFTYMYVQNLNSFNLICEKRFEDTKEIIRRSKSKNMCIYWKNNIKQRLHFSTNMLYSTSIERKC